MRKLIIAYHAYLFNDRYMGMMVPQFQLLLSSGLYQACDKLYIGVVDTPDKRPANGIDWVKDFWKFSSSKENNETRSKVEIVVYPDNKEEANTLKWVKDYSVNNPDDYVLYFHTKGITHYTPATESWRKYMEYFVIENWKDCIVKLDEGHDCCGVRWHTNTFMGKFPHFSGGMWWAKTSYINTLNHEYLDLPIRFYREFWIGSNPNVKQFVFHDNGVNPYAVVYDRSNYEKK